MGRLIKNKIIFPKSMKGRWLLTSFGSVSIVLIILEIMIVVFVHNFFYLGIRNNIDNNSTIISNFLSRYTLSETTEFNSVVKNYVDSFPDKRLSNLTVYNYQGNVIASSDGVCETSSYDMPDYEEAKTSKDKYGYWVGMSSSGEKVMAVTRFIYNGDICLGAIRYVVSLENADRLANIVILVGMIVGLGVLLFVFLSNLYFIKSIIHPVKEIGIIAKKIAHGDFKATISKRNDDEIGELCDTINHMAVELGESEKMKNDFISSVSHELRTPLTAIKGWAETIKDEGEKNEIFDKGIDVIITESERLCKMVEELLDFSKIQSGRVSVNMQPVDIMVALNETIDLINERAKKENKQLIYVKQNKPVFVVGDANRIKQVLLNILDNALKYTDEAGYVKVDLSIKNGVGCITIKDTGCGISVKHLPNVKSKFYKANHTRKGSGIGLAVADEIVRAHHGELNITSKENVGTTVEIRLPLTNES